jgi:hypothetical protein
MFVDHRLVFLRKREKCPEKENPCGSNHRQIISCFDLTNAACIRLGSGHPFTLWVIDGPLPETTPNALNAKQTSDFCRNEALGGVVSTAREILQTDIRPQ